MVHSVIALEGLSESDLGQLFQYLPLSSGLVQGWQIRKIASALPAAQACWSELLTGRPWFESGCTGYSFPGADLNTLHVFSESDLLCSKSEFVSISTLINIPIVKPRKEQVWLSDGSLPTNRLVSPAGLRVKQPYKSYEPRPFPSLAVLQGTNEEAAQRCIEVELKRIECWLDLLREERVGPLICRISVFDYLTHLIGLNFLASSDMTVMKMLRDFFNKLDIALSTLLNSEKPTYIVSLFSHEPCRATINLNRVLQRGGFLELESENSLSRQLRVGAVTELYHGKPTQQQLATYEGRLVLDKTIAASPVSGSVFINRHSVFKNGIVAENSYHQNFERVRNYLIQALGAHYGMGFELHINPKTGSDENVRPAADMILTIPGVEFTNLPPGYGMMPRTTHSPQGFVFCSGKTELGDLDSTHAFGQFLSLN